jgi:phosphopantetheinyl transferase
LLADYQQLLNVDELAGCQRMRQPGAAHSALVTRVLQRWVLSRYARVAPADWQFSLAAAGKPQIASSTVRLDFNVSHSGDWVVCAVTAGGAVGVDIEQERPNLDLLRLGRRVLADSEYQRLLSLPAREQPGLFHDYWTLKESWIKYTGQGLAAGLQGFSFGLDSRGKIEFQPPRELPEGVVDGQFWLLEGPADHYLALCGAARWGRDAVISAYECRPLVDYQTLEMPLRARSERTVR